MLLLHSVCYNATTTEDTCKTELITKAFMAL